MGTVRAITSAPSRRGTPAATPPPALTPEELSARRCAGQTLLTTRELSREIKRHPRSIRRDVAAGCPAHPMGRDHRFILSDVLAWHRARREAAGAPREDHDAA